MNAMKLMMIGLLLLFSIAVGQDTPPVAAFFLEAGTLTATGLTEKQPLPDGTEVKVYWDWDENGPDAKDPQPVVGTEAGNANFNTFKLNGVEMGMGPGKFITDPMFNIVGTLPKPSTYYLRICLGDKQLVSNVVKLSSGLADYEFKEWTVDSTPCKSK